MKILLINKFHYLESGAARSYFDTAKLLEEAGHEVAFFSMHDKKNISSQWEKYFVDNVDYNKPLSLIYKIKNACNLIYNFSAQKRLQKLINDFKPDIAHLHNIYHQLSPSIIATLKKNNVPMVMTLHDYKLICPNYNLFVRNQIWGKSKPDKYWRCFTDKCFKDSYAQSLLVSLESFWHHKVLKSYSKVDVFISPSQFLIDKFKEYDFKGEIKYLPNPLVDFKPGQTDGPQTDDEYMLYFGRLSSEKGVADLIKAYLESGVNIKLKIAGTGPEEQSLQKLALGNDKIEFLGWQNDQALNKLIKNSLFVVVPSRWYENAPYSVVETMALGKAVLCPRLGGLEEMLVEGETGFYYQPLDFHDLGNKIKYLLKNKDKLGPVGKQAQKAVKEKNDKDKYVKNLIDIYESLKK